MGKRVSNPTDGYSEKSKVLYGRHIYIIVAGESFPKSFMEQQMVSLIDELNQKRKLMPHEVMDDLVRQFQEEPDVCVSSVARLLSIWCVESMPNIAAYHGVEQTQVIDSLQHYRFGMRQAQNLTVASGTDIPDYELLSLFTIFHDIGRMMVGSGASKFRYPAMDGNLLHPVVGAIMLRQAFSVIDDSLNPPIRQLLEALVYTTERHTLSIGLTKTAVDKSNISKLIYYEDIESLLLVDAAISSDYVRYAHLVALADLVNNVSEKLAGTIEYQPIHEVPGNAMERVEYVRNGQDSGLFQVLPAQTNEMLTVRRCWRDGIPISKENFDMVQEKMEWAAIRFTTSEEEREKASIAFKKGFSNAFPKAHTC